MSERRKKTWPSFRAARGSPTISSAPSLATTPLSGVGSTSSGSLSSLYLVLLQVSSPSGPDKARTHRSPQLAFRRVGRWCTTFQFRPSFRSCLNLAANRSRAAISSCRCARSRSFRTPGVVKRSVHTSSRMYRKERILHSAPAPTSPPGCALPAASSCGCPSQRTGDGGRRDLVSAEARARKRPGWCASRSGKRA